MPLRALFEQPTLGSLAEQIQHNQSAPVRPPIVVSERTDKQPLSFAQQRLWLLQQLNPESGFFNMPLALRLDGQLNFAALHASFGEIVRRHQYAARALSVDGPALLLETTNGDLASVPAFLGGFVAMEPGEYELPATGETVVDPDWFMPWVVDLTDGASAADAARVTFVPETW